MEASRVFQAHLRELDSIMIWIREHIQKSHLDKTEARKMEIAIEEAVVNVMHYAYGSLPGLLEIRFKMDEKKGMVRFELRDQGFPFNPIENRKKPDFESAACEREPGGLGIHFMCEMTDEIHYARDGECNILTLSKNSTNGNS